MFKLSFHQKLMGLISIHASLVLYAMITNWSWWYLFLAIMISKLFNTIGNEVGLHRYWTHQTFKTKHWKESIMHVFSIPMLYGSTLTYVGVHRAHHAYADTEKDPHIAESWWRMMFYVRRPGWKIENRFIADLMRDPVHKWLHRHYFKINTGILLLSLVILGPVYTGWFLSYMIVYLFIFAGLVNTLGHRPNLGDRPFDTGDRSSNNTFLKWTTWNEGYHNNHHAFTNSYTHAVKPGEFDFPAYFIKYFFMEKDE
jgi:fatty-acid desaturase